MKSSERGLKNLIPKSTLKLFSFRRINYPYRKRRSSNGDKLYVKSHLKIPYLCTSRSYSVRCLRILRKQRAEIYRSYSTNRTRNPGSALCISLARSSSYLQKQLQRCNGDIDFAFKFRSRFCAQGKFIPPGNESGEGKPCKFHCQTCGIKMKFNLRLFVRRKITLTLQP